MEAKCRQLDLVLEARDHVPALSLAGWVTSGNWLKLSGPWVPIWKKEEITPA